MLWGYVFGALVASSAYGYTHSYKTEEERRRLAETFGTNHAASALFGPTAQLQTVTGFTVYKVSMTVMVVGSIWALLTSTRLLRGDEEAGRWELLIGGQTTRGGAALQVLGGLGWAVAALWAVTAVVIVVAGRSSFLHIGAPAALYFSLALVASAVMFLAVGALTSQLAPSRRRAAGYAAVVLGLSYGVRMVGDAGVGLHWLVWASPLGWVEQLRPLTHPRPWALVPIGMLSATLALLAVGLARRRDVGAGLWSERTTRAPRLRLLSGATGLTLRLTGSSTRWWTVGVAVGGLLMGIVAKAAGAAIVGSSVEKVYARLGAPGTGTATFLGVAFLVLAIVVAGEAVSRVGALRAEEAEGRLDHVVAAAVSRSRWLEGRLAVATGAVLLSGAVAGIFAWVGTASQGATVSLGAVFDAGLNAVAPALFLLGIGALAFGLRPRRATAVVAVVLGWSTLIDLVGGFFAESHWVVDTSLFHQMASAPAVPPDWRTNSVLIGIGVLAMLLGVRAFRHRDLQGE